MGLSDHGRAGRKYNELSELSSFLLPVLISSFASNPGEEKKNTSWAIIENQYIV